MKFSRSTDLLKLAWLASISLPTASAQTTGGSNKPPEVVEYELTAITGVSNLRNLPLNLSTSLKGKPPVPGTPTAIPNDTDIKWSGSAGEPTFSPSSGGSSVEIDFTRPFVKTTSDAATKFTASYSPSASSSSSPGSSLPPPSVTPSSQTKDLDRIYLDFLVADTEDTKDDFILVRPTTSQLEAGQKTVLHWAKVTVKHNRGEALKLKITNSTSSGKPLYFLDQEEDPNPQTKDPALTSELEKEFDEGKFFWLGSAEKGEGEGKFKVQGDLGSGYKDAPEEKTVKLVPVEVEEVTFHGNQTVKKDDGSGDYDGADWSDQNHDNDANDEGEHHWPICYIKGDTMGVSAKIKCDLPNAVSVTVRARIPANSPASGGSEIIFGPSGALTSSNGFIECPRIDATTANDSTKTNHLEKMELVWEIQAAGSGEWVAISKTQHTFYSLYGQPIETSKLYHTVLHLACSIPGASNWNQVVDNVWANFAGPANVKAWNRATKMFDRPLHYYKDGVVQQAVGKTTARLLIDGNGQCDAWMELFLDALKAHGESTSVAVQINGGGDEAAFLLVIKNWAIAQGAPDPPHIRLPTADPNLSNSNGNVQYGDMVSEAGLPGQNMATPFVKIFGGHAAAKYGNTYYDPSYGVTYADQQDFENKAVIGYAINFAENPTDPADLSVQPTTFSVILFAEFPYPSDQ